MKKFAADNSEVKGYITGRYLVDTSVKLLNQDLVGTAIKLDGTPTDTRLNFIVNTTLPIEPNKTLKIGVVKKDSTHETDLTISYHPDPPALEKTDPAAVTQGDKDKPVTITGTNFLPGATVQAGDGVKVMVPQDGVKNSKNLQATFTVDEQAAVGPRKVTVTTPGGSSTDNLTVTVQAKATPATSQPPIAPKPAVTPAPQAPKSKPAAKTQ
jgi:hypothetical protein